MDNPDQRIAVDARAFTDTTLTFSLTIFNALIDLISFSGAKLALGLCWWPAAGCVVCDVWLLMPQSVSSFLGP